MKKSHIEIFGYLGGAMTTASFVPQIITSLKHKDEKLNPAFMWVFLMGLILWIIYAALIIREHWEEDDSNEGTAIVVFSSLQVIGVLVILFSVGKKDGHVSNN